jgi:5-hydroxyisourate hydrolase
VTTVSTHILDTATGRPAAGVPVELAQLTADGWQALGAGRTDADGRCRELPAPDPAEGTVLRLTFAVATPFFPEVAVVFAIDPAQSHYHVPLLLSPYGYSVYRGS